MSGPRTPYAVDKSGAQSDRREPIDRSIDITAAIHEIIAKIERQAIELEQARIAREQWGDENAELARVLAENAKLQRRVNDLDASIRQEIKNRNCLADQLRDAQNERAVERMAADNVEQRRQALALRVEELERFVRWQSGSVSLHFKYSCKLIEERDGLQKVVRDFSKITDFMSRRKDSIAGGFVPDLVIALIKNLEDERDALRTQVNDLEILSGELTQARATIAEQKRDEADFRAKIKDQAETIREQAKEIERLNGRRIEWRCDKCGSRFSRDIEDPRGCPNCTADGNSKTFMSLHD